MFWKKRREDKTSVRIPRICDSEGAGLYREWWSASRIRQRMRSERKKK